MGWRAVRIALDRPHLFRQQVRAMIRAAGGRPLSVMFPMIAEVGEFTAARKLLDLELARAVRRGEPTPERLRVGAMFEVPALAWQLPALLAAADFISVGSNDLRQFMFASDRGNPRVAERYDVLSPAFMRLLRDLARQCQLAGVPVAVCGEMAGRPLEAMALVGLGFRSLSMAPRAVGAVRLMLRSLDLSVLRRFLDEALAADEGSLRRSLGAFAERHDVAL